MKLHLIQETPISLADAREELSKIKVRDGALNFRAAKCEEYFNDIQVIASDKCVELRKKLQDAGISRLKEEHILKIIDLLPPTADDVKIVLGSTPGLSKKDLEQLASIVSEFVK